MEEAIPLLWRSPACRWSFRIRIQIHVPRLYLSMFWVGGWKHESMWVCKKTIGQRVTLLSDLLCWVTGACGKVQSTADYFLPVLFSLCISAGRVGNCSLVPISLKQNNGLLIIWNFCALSLSFSLSLSLFLSLSLSQFLPCIDYFVRFLYFAR